MTEFEKAFNEFTIGDLDVRDVRIGANWAQYYLLTKDPRVKALRDALERSSWHHDTLNDYSHINGMRICQEALAAFDAEVEKIKGK